MRTIDPEHICRVSCMVCREYSDYTRYADTVPWANRYGWATCTDCAVTVDPDHPEEPPVMPFPRASYQEGAGS